MTLPRGRTHGQLSHLLHLLDGVKPLSSPSTNDSLQWTLDVHQGFSVASAYAAINTATPTISKGLIDSIWHKHSPPRVRIFTWKLAQSILPTSWNLLCKGIIAPDFDPMCSLCSSDLEDHDHLFISCPAVQPLWISFFSWWNIPAIMPPSTLSLLEHCQFFTSHKGINHLIHLCCVCLLWSIWYARNNLRFKGLHWDPEQLFHFMQSCSFAWLRGLSPEIIFTWSDWILFPLNVGKLF